MSPPLLKLRNGPVLVYDWRQFQVRAGRGGYGVAFELDLAVRNDAYVKDVRGIWRIVTDPTGGQPGTSTWQSTPLAYGGLIGDGYERWTGHCELMGHVVDRVELAGCVMMNGQTFWDNNSGANFQLTSDLTPSPGDGIRCQAALSRAGGLLEFSGEAWTVEFGGEQQVTVIYTTDAWQSSISAPIQKTEDGSWYWRVPLGRRGVEKVEYCLRYSVCSADFWDNNGGANYVVSTPTRPRGPGLSRK